LSFAGLIPTLGKLFTKTAMPLFFYVIYFTFFYIIQKEMITKRTFELLNMQIANDFANRKIK